MSARSYWGSRPEVVRALLKFLDRRRHVRSLVYRYADDGTATLEVECFPESPARARKREALIKKCRLTEIEPWPHRPLTDDERVPMNRADLQRRQEELERTGRAIR